MFLISCTSGIVQGVRPSDEEFRRERKLLDGTTLVFLNTNFENRGKVEIYDSLGDTEKEKIKDLFKKVIEILYC